MQTTSYAALALVAALGLSACGSDSRDVEGQQVRATFGDWGEPVTITAPPADQMGTFEVPLS